MLVKCSICGNTFEVNETMLEMDKLKNTMKECLEMRGYEVTNQKLEEEFSVYEDCQEWNNDKMLTGNTYEEIEDFVKHSSCIDELFDTKGNQTDREYISQIAKILEEMLGDSEPSDEELDYDYDYDAIELYENLHNVKQSLQNLGYI